MIRVGKNNSMNRRGIVLFLVVSIVLMLTLLTYGFLVSMRTQNLAAAQSGDQLQARQAAFSARALVCTILESPLSRRFELKQNGSQEQLFANIRLDLEERDQPDELAISGFVVQSPDSSQFGFVNESSKIDLRTLLANDEKIPGWGRTTLMRLPNMTDTLADQILDWIDSDNEPREFGAESDFYFENSLTPPRNDVPLDLRELSLIPEVTHEMIFGNQSSSKGGNNRASLDSESASTDDAGSWSDFLTIGSGERNETFEGEPRINLNSPDLFELHSRLSEKTSVEIANYVVLVRQYGLAADSSAASTDMNSAGQIQIDFTVSATYEIESKLDLLNSKVQIGSDDEETTFVQSPLSQTTTSLDDQTIGFLDGTTISSARFFRGRVNLMLARREVLLSIPGVDESLADQIITGREAQQDGPKTCFWLLENGLVNMEQMRQLEHSITNRGEVCRFVYGGWSDKRSAPVVYEVVLDATDGISRQIFCRRILETRTIMNQFKPQGIDR